MRRKYYYCRKPVVVSREVGGGTDPDDYYTGGYDCSHNDYPKNQNTYVDLRMGLDGVDNRNLCGYCTLVDHRDSKVRLDGAESTRVDGIH